MNKPKQILADICDVIEALRHEASLCRHLTTISSI